MSTFLPVKDYMHRTRRNQLIFDYRDPLKSIFSCYQMYILNHLAFKLLFIFLIFGAYHSEHNLISLQEFTKNLGSRTVAYLNVDISVEGNYTFRLKSTPTLYESVFSATKRVSMDSVILISTDEISY